MKEYTRLPGRGIKRGVSSLFVRTRARLYAGKDHLLCLYNAGYSEEYKRFYYKDIQAIVTCKTARGKIWNIIFSVFVVIFALLSFTVNDIWRIVLLMITCLFVIFLLINWLRGPTCVSHLYTAVTKEELLSLSRLRNALKVMNYMRPIIEDAQGKLTAEELRTKVTDLSKRDALNMKPHAMPPAPVQEVKHYRGRAHEVLFFVLLLDGIMTSLEVFSDNIVISFLGFLITTALSITVIAALIKQHSSNLTKALKTITWVTLAYVCSGFIVGTAIYTSFLFKNPGVRNNEFEMLKMFSTLPILENPILSGIFIFFIVYSFLIGALGLVLLRKLKNEGYC